MGRFEAQKCPRRHRNRYKSDPMLLFYSQAMKKSFIIHSDSYSLLKRLSDAQKGRLFCLCFDYNSGGIINEDIEDPIVMMAFQSFQNQFDRDNQKYEKIVERNRLNGLAGGRPPKDANPDNPMGFLGTQQNPDEPKKPDSDSDSDSVNNSKKEKDISPIPGEVSFPENSEIPINTEKEEKEKSCAKKEKTEHVGKSDNFKKFEKWITGNAPRVGKMKEPFTEIEFEALKNDFPLNEIQELLKSMHNYEPLLKKNISANLTFRNWIKKQYDGKSNNTGRSKEILGDTAKRTTTIPRPNRDE